jgi:hypothetical protein
MDSITNEAGQTFTVGKRVRHSDGWEGTIIGIKYTPTIDLLLVNPDNDGELTGRDALVAIAPEHAERIGRATFCRPRDEGRSMGNYTPIN